MTNDVLPHGAQRILRMCVCEHVDVDVRQYTVHSTQYTVL